MHDERTVPASGEEAPLRFTRLFVAHQAAFRGFLLSLVHDYHAVDDLVQELAARMWRRFGEYDAARPFVAWGLGFARLVAFEWRRRQARLPVPVDEPTLHALAELAAERAAGDDARREALHECLRHLTDHQRRVLHARYHDERSVAQIAAAAQRTEMAVYKVLKRAHEVLLECMQRALGRAAPIVPGS